MGEEYGRLEWRKDEAAATAEAIRRIEAAIANGETVLDFTDLTAMTRLPDALAGAQGVRGIYAGYTRPDGSFAGFDDLRRLSDLSALAGLSALTALNLSRTRVTDLSALAGLTALTALDLSRTGVTDLSALAGLTALTALNLSQTKVTDLSALAGLTALISLDLSFTNVTDLSALSGLSALISLNLSYTRVTDLSALAGLFALTSLNLSSTQVTGLSVLLKLPQFAAEKARFLNFQVTPAASREADPNMEALSGLPGDRCAIETVQYLKGTHPLYRDPQGKGNGGTSGAGLAQRLAEDSSVQIVVEAGLLQARNAGAPERQGPRELAQRVAALREHLGEILHEAPGRQVPVDLLRRFQRYARALAHEEVTYILLDGPIAALRGGVNDPYVTAALEGGFVEMWRTLIKMHDDLRPLLLPPEEDDLPDLPPEATPEAGIELAEQVATALEEARAQGVVGESVEDTALAAKDYFEVAKEATEKKPSWIKRGFVVVAGLIRGIVGLGALAEAGSKVHSFLESPAGQALVNALREVWEALRKLFGP